MKKFFTVFCAILMSVMTLMAQDLVFEGVAYNFLNEEELEVVALPGGEKYTGVVKIPYSVVIGEEGPVVGVTSIAYEDESEVMTYRVTKVGDYAFKYCTEMTKLQMPYSLEVIGVEAVSGCTSLEAITMPTNLVRIGDRAFEGSQIGSLTVSGGLKEIGDRVFYNTIATDIMLDHSELTAFGKETFTGSTVQRILLPSKLKSIPEDTFRGCKVLSYVGFNASLEEIGDNAFKDCCSLVALSLPMGLKSIGKDSFAGDEVKSISFEGLEAPQYSIEAICGAAIPSLVAFPASAEPVYNGWCPEMFDGKSSILVGGEYASDLSKWVYTGDVSVSALPSVVGYGVTLNAGGNIIVLAAEGGSVSMCFPYIYGGGYDIEVNGEKVEVETVYENLGNFFSQNALTSFIGDSKMLSLENLAGNYSVNLVDDGVVGIGKIKAQDSLISYDPSRKIIKASEALISVYDLRGRIIARGIDSLSTDNLSAGIYMVVTPNGSRKIFVR